MLIYFLFLIIPLILGLLHSAHNKNTTLYVWLYFIPLLLFCGLRDGVGPDWGGYAAIYESNSYADIKDILDYSEPSFFLLNKLSESLGFGLYGVIFFCAFVFLWGVFSYALTTSNPWLAISVVMPYFIFIIGLSGIRQATAIGFAFYMLANWNTSSIIAKVFFLVLATSFHNSAIVLCIYPILFYQGRLFLQILMATLFGLFLVYQAKNTSAYEMYHSRYIEQEVVSYGAFLHVTLSALPATLYLLNRGKVTRVMGNNLMIDLTSIMVIVALPLTFLSSTAVDRLTLYFSFIQMWIYPAIIQTFSSNRGLWKAIVSVIVIAIFFGYFLLGIHSFAYIPYNNILFN